MVKIYSNKSVGDLKLALKSERKQLENTDTADINLWKVSVSCEDLNIALPSIEDVLLPMAKLSTLFTNDRQDEDINIDILINVTDSSEFHLVFCKCFKRIQVQIAPRFTVSEHLVDSTQVLIHSRAFFAQSFSLYIQQ
jgi:hypothetical protein